jgi:hypothetical protein
LAALNLKLKEHEWFSTHSTCWLEALAKPITLSRKFTELTLWPRRCNSFSMKSITTLFALAVALSLQSSSIAQTNASVVVPVRHTNTAIIPVPRTSGSVTNRQNLVLQRARENPGDYDIEFIGDSMVLRITLGICMFGF